MTASFHSHPLPAFILLAFLLLLCLLLLLLLSFFSSQAEKRQEGRDENRGIRIKKQEKNTQDGINVTENTERLIMWNCVTRGKIKSDVRIMDTWECNTEYTYPPVWNTLFFPGALYCLFSWICLLASDRRLALSSSPLPPLCVWFFTRILLLSCFSFHFLHLTLLSIIPLFFTLPSPLALFSSSPSLLLVLLLLSHWAICCRHACSVLQPI